EIPPLLDTGEQVGEGQVFAAEEVDVRGQLQALQNPARLVVEVCGRDPHARRGGAEAEPGQPRAQDVPAVALGLRYREDGQYPTVRQPGHGTLENPPVALGEDLPGPRRQGVAGGAVHLRRVEDAAALEPGDRRAYGGLVDVQFGHEPDEGGHRMPAAGPPRERPVRRHDEGARLEPAGFPDTL